MATIKEIEAEQKKLLEEAAPYQKKIDAIKQRLDKLEQDKYYIQRELNQVFGG